jgi:hypothetical protein
MVVKNYLEQRKTTFEKTVSNQNCIHDEISDMQIKVEQSLVSLSRIFVFPRPIIFKDLNTQYLY